MMKGLIAYSSLTGNTKTLAEKLAVGLAELGDWTLVDIKKGASTQGYDCVLAGGWIDRAWPDKVAKQWIQALPKEIPCGIFVTMGAEPSSEHGDRVRANLDSLLECFKVSLDKAILPGLVDPVLLERVRKMPAQALGENGESIREQMVAAGERSRVATEEEYEEAVAAFRKTIQDKIS